jgi:type VI secretion system protein ImpA
MSDLEEASAQVQAWLQPLADESGPSGADLEYDNAFLELTQAAAGKPESQFGPAEPPDWPAVREGAAALFERTRDLRVAIYWLRAGVRLQGYAGLPSGLQLVGGLVEQMWDTVHPLPDPDDGDPYARVNALTLLREPAGLLGDLHATPVLRERALGEVLGRSVALACGLVVAAGDETPPSRDTLARTLAAAVERLPTLRDTALDVAERVRALQVALNDRLGGSDAPDLKPLQDQVDAVAALMPAADGASALDEAAASGSADGAPAGAGFSGVVGSRDEALRAIDMVCEYLERTEPSNPAPLFLRRARQLVNHNFLQLMKELAPGVMPDVARIVGVDPDSVQTPENP